MRGFSLVETLISIAILITGLTSVTMLFSYSVKASIRNRHRTTATLLLSNKMDELKNTDNPTPGGYSELAAVEGSVIPYRVTWRVSETRTATVVVYLTQEDSPGGDVELARGTLLAGGSYK